MPHKACQVSLDEDGICWNLARIETISVSDRLSKGGEMGGSGKRMLSGVLVVDVIGGVEACLSWKNILLKKGKKIKINITYSLCNLADPFQSWVLEHRA
jgi:hypothetical protein